MKTRKLEVDGKVYDVYEVHAWQPGWGRVVLKNEKGQPVASHGLPADFIAGRVRNTLITGGSRYRWVYEGETK